ncbi:MAG: EAL domain-containing protein [Lachnospiraceae bacterium]|nr:EAL domain-containing protein [Lachnospiraceae bacterium]
MVSGYYYDISTLLVLLCLMYAFFLQSLHRVEENTVFFSALLCGTLSSLLSIIYYLQPFHQSSIMVPFYVSSWALTAVSISLLILFLYRDRAYNIGIWKQLVFVGLPFAMDVIFIILASFGLFSGFRTAAYCCDLILFLVGINILYVYKKNTTIERMVMLWLMMIVVIAATVVEMLYPDITIQRFAIALLLAEAFFNLSDPEVQFDEDTGLLGLESFKDEMLRRYYYLKRHGGTISMELLIIQSTESFLRLLGEVNELKLRHAVISELKRIADGAAVYKIRQGIYVFLPEKGDRNEADRIHSSLLRRFESTFGNDAYEMEIPFSTCRIDLPEMAQDGAAFTDLLHMIIKSSRETGKSVIDVSELDLTTEEYMREVDEKVRNALNDGNLEVYYQPIYSLKEKRFVSAEALLRLHDGDKFIPPDLFITIAENNGSIVEIDDFVIRQVCKMVSTRNLHDIGIRFIEINLSVSDMLQDDITGKLAKMVDSYHIHPSQINIEITETSDDTFTGVVESNAKRLSGLGFHFSLDDFGTGYSSLSRIIMMPFDIIKLDKSIIQAPFVMETEQERTNAGTLLSSSVDMVRQIGAQTVAEGVETKEQLEAMERMGVDFIQGFYFSKPVPESDFINLVKSMNHRERHINDQYIQPSV